MPNPRLSKEDELQFKLLREARKRKTLLMRGGILISEKEYEEMRNKTCGGCGGEKINPKPWFGELFCGECVEAFKHGKSR